MSLILEALKKLERDKQVPDRGGFLVMAARPWPSSEDSGRRLFFASLTLAGVGVLGMAVAGVWWWEHRQAPVPVAAAVPVTAPAAPAAVSRVRAAAIVPAAAAAPAAKVAVVRAPAAAPAKPEAPAAKPAAVEAAPVEAPAVEPAPAKKPPAELRLTAISEKDGKRVAILNERTVYEGDSFDGVTVVRIGENEVELDVNGRRRVIAF